MGTVLIKCTLSNRTQQSLALGVLCCQPACQRENLFEANQWAASCACREAGGPAACAPWPGALVAVAGCSVTAVVVFCRGEDVVAVVYLPVFHVKAKPRAFICSVK